MRRVVLLVAVAGAACGGGGGGGGGTVGTPGGGALIVTGTLPLSASSFAVVNGGASCSLGNVGYGVAFAAILASDQPGICGYLQRNQNKANARSVGLAVIRVDPSNRTTTLTTGAYPVTTTPSSQGTFAVVQVTHNDASCSPSDVTATGGSVQVTSVTGGEIQGTIDATLSDGGKITGSFDAAPCAVTFPGDVCSGSIGPVNPTCAP